MAPLFAPLFAGFSAAAPAAAAAGSAAATVAVPGIAGASTIVPAFAAPAISLSTILQGTATVLGLVSSVAAGNAEAEKYNMEATDTERQKPLETLQGIKRRSSIKRELAGAVGAINTAYAASGVDLSTGTAASARKAAFRDADLALTTEGSTEEVADARLTERAANYRRSAKIAKRMGVIQGLTGAIGNVGSIIGRGY